jgi:hypothetical protein
VDVSVLFQQGLGLRAILVLSQISILGAKSENRVSAIQWLTDSQTLEKANLRQNPTQRIDEITIGNTPILDLDRDVVVLGDYNTMGRQDSPPVSAQEELAVMDGELAPGFRRLSMTPNCTEYFEGKAGALAHVVASTGMQEAAATARVTGYCALAACTDLAGRLPAAAQRLSDHCPVVVDIQDRDLD